MYFLINGSVSSWLSQLSSFWKIIYGFDIFAGIFFAGNIGVVLACDGGFFPDDRPTKRPL